MSDTSGMHGNGVVGGVADGEGRSRRGMLRAAVAGAGAVAVGGAGAGVAHADGRRRSAPTFVIVHGSSGNSYGYAPLLAELGLRGHRAVAVDLPGHGAGAYLPVSYQTQDLEALKSEPSPLSEVTLTDFVAHVTAVVRRAHRVGPVVLVGQSMGGATLNRVADEVPELISHLVYASAYCPTPKHSTLMSLMMTQEGLTSALFKIPPVRTVPGLGVNRVNWRSGDPALFAAAKEALAADWPDAEVRMQLNLMEPDESAALPTSDASARPERWGRIPRTYLRFTEDRAIPPALQDLMIREADELTPRNRFRVRSLAATHLGPRDPREFADELELVARLCR
ncbi:alpha/beta hydrolase [Streptomyces purpureus]|nr:alpha/beta hydrolase [Streptomyces purpureus]